MVVDSTPVDCARSRETVKRSDLARWAQYGYRASHSPLLLGFAAAPAMHAARTAGRVRAHRSQSRRTAGAAGHPARRPRPHQPASTDHDRRQELLRRRVRSRPARGQHRATAPSPHRRSRTSRLPGLQPLRQIIESINDTLKGQFHLEHHGGRTPAGVLVRVCQRILAMTAAIWHNDHIGTQIKRSLTAYDH